jgi:uncharacterized protein (DUF1501 family)
MAKHSRRAFLKTSSAGAVALGLAACAPRVDSVRAPGEPVPDEACVVPAAPIRRVVAVPPERRTLVVVQLSGGNDGLNMLVPYGEGRYYDLRPELALPGDQVVPLDGALGLHPSLKAFKELYDQGKLALIQGVGYPNPNRSHFRSMDIWHTARPQTNADEGWLGAFMAQVYRAGESPFQCVNLGNNIPKALWTPHAPTAALQDTRTFQFLADRRLPTARDPLLKTFSHMYGKPSRQFPAVQLVADTWDTVARGVDVLRAAGEKYQPAAAYPAHPFGKTVQQIAQMVAAELGTRVFYVSLGSFDTHANEKGPHANLLTQVSEGLAALQQDLEQMGRADGVLVLGFSEFGRRVRENGSGGTDHGAAGPMFALGNGVRGGLYGDAPNLADLDDGDLRHTVDFRSVYASVLEDWLGVASQTILGGSYDRLEFIL